MGVGELLSITLPLPDLFVGIMTRAERQALLLLATLLGLGVGSIASPTAPSSPSCFSATVHRQSNASRAGEYLHSSRLQCVGLPSGTRVDL